MLLRMTRLPFSHRFLVLSSLLLASFVSLGQAGHAPAQSTVPTASMRLLWSDEFNAPDGSGVDPTKWSIVTGGNGFGNKELESYTARRENLRIEGGNLVVEARQEQYTGADGIARPYTSGRLETQGHFAPTYGRFEARMKLPTGKGIWPAFWMLGDESEAKDWPARGEIDIMEGIGEPAKVYSTIHGPGYSGSHGPQGHYDFPAGEAVDTGFHTYAVDWSPNRLQFSVDGHVTVTQTPETLPPGTKWVYDHPFFILFDFAVGGQWPGYPDATTRFPRQMLVDWVRVYGR